MYLLDSLCKDEPEDDANAIAATMSRLKHLELRYHVISSNECVLNILSGCPQLEHLDLRGSLKVEVDHQSLKHKFPKLKIVDLPLSFAGGSEWMSVISILRLCLDNGMFV